MFERCQFECSISAFAWPLGAVRDARTGWRRLRAVAAPRVGLGAPSRFPAGDWVRVRDADAIRATLDADGRLRRLLFTDVQWRTCGRTYRVGQVVRRMLNDDGRMVRISRTVSLEGVLCDGEERSGGCGRSCPLLYRDDWLEPAEPPPQAVPAPADATYARVRSLAEIQATLDSAGRCDGIPFVPEMVWFAGGRFRVRKQVTPAAATWWRRPAGEWYVMEGLHCRGEALGAVGPCDRGCSLLWHRRWLAFER